MTHYSKRWRNMTRGTSSRLGIETLENRVLLSGTPLEGTIFGIAQWMDSLGNKHPIPNATVQIRAATGADTDEPLATTNTTADGSYNTGSITLDPDSGPFFVRVVADGPADTVVKPDGTKAHADSSTITLSGSDPFLISRNLLGDGIDNEGFSVHSAVVLANQYATTTLGANNLRKIQVNYPSDETGFQSATQQMFIEQTDRWDWDVIDHEYGHYVALKAGFLGTATGTHESGHEGIGLAWNEGWATYFAIAAQKAMATQPYAVGVSGVGDSTYDDTEVTAPEVDIHLNLMTTVGVGEDDEDSIATSLYHLATGDLAGATQGGIQIPDAALYADFAEAKPMTIGAAWDSLAQSLAPQLRTKLGLVLGLENIAPSATGPDGLIVNENDLPPTFTWSKGGDANGAGSNNFQIQFFNSNFSTLLDTIDGTTQTGLDDVDQYQPNVATWVDVATTIFKDDSTVKWAVEGKDTTAPETPGATQDLVLGGNLDRYWSNALTLNYLPAVDLNGPDAGVGNTAVYTAGRDPQGDCAMMGNLA